MNECISEKAVPLLQDELRRIRDEQTTNKRDIIELKKQLQHISGLNRLLMRLLSYILRHRLRCDRLTVLADTLESNRPTPDIEFGENIGGDSVVTISLYQ